MSRLVRFRYSAYTSVISISFSKPARAASPESNSAVTGTALPPTVAIAVRMLDEVLAPGRVLHLAEIASCDEYVVAIASEQKRCRAAQSGYGTCRGQQHRRCPNRAEDRVAAMSVLYHVPVEGCERTDHPRASACFPQPGHGSAKTRRLRAPSHVREARHRPTVARAIGYGWRQAFGRGVARSPPDSPRPP